MTSLFLGIVKYRCPFTVDALVFFCFSLAQGYVVNEFLEPVSLYAIKFVIATHGAVKIELTFIFGVIIHVGGISNFKKYFPLNKIRSKVLSRLVETKKLLK